MDERVSQPFASLPRTEAERESLAYTRFDAAVWPDGARQFHTPAEDMDEAIALCTQRRRAVQAGGCVGIFAQYLSGFFERVATFEPDLENFKCIAANVTAENVDPLRCALSDRFESGTVAHNTENPGASLFTEGGKEAFAHPLDSCGYADVDFIQLDVEGYELRALKGAEQTIRRSWPVIMVELKGLGVRLGDSDDDVRAWLTGMGYVKAGRRNKDHWFTHPTGL